MSWQWIGDVQQTESLTGPAVAVAAVVVAVEGAGVGRVGPQGEWEGRGMGRSAVVVGSVC